MENCFLFQCFADCLSAPYSHAENDVSFDASVRSGQLVIFFEPSNGKVDWFNNLDFAAVPYRNGQSCHSGFLRVFESALPYLMPFFLDSAVKEALIVGYSHGAALALFCHDSLLTLRPDLKGSCLTLAYGMPRVLRGKIVPSLAAHLDGFVRVTNVGDIVTHLPPAALGFRHVGRELRIGQLGRYSPTVAHRPENYLAELDNAANTYQKRRSR